MLRITIMLLLSGYCLACVGAVAAAPQADKSLTADEHYQAQRWVAAAAAYRKVTQAEPGSARAWFRLGVSLSELGENAPALDALTKAESNGVPGSLVAYERARIHAGEGRRDQALAALEKAVAGGYTRFESIQSDARLAQLAGDARFAASIETARAARYPCVNNAHFRDFDFWIGEWEVRTADGTLAGTNRILREEHGCLLLEKWTSATGGTGTSVNYYDARSDTWAQLWVSEGGLLIDIRGGLRNGSMVLSGEAHYASSGQTAAFRGTWTPLDDGRVRQFFEQSTDGGSTWTAWFEGFYARVSGSPEP